MIYQDNDLYEYVATRLVDGKWEKGYATGIDVFKDPRWSIGKNPNFDAILFKAVMATGGFSQ